MVLPRRHERVELHLHGDVAKRGNNVPNTVDYFEIGSPDPQTSKAFYASLFGWAIGPQSPANYSMVSGD